MRRPSLPALAVLLMELAALVSLMCSHLTLPTALLMWASILSLAALQLRTVHPERSRAGR